MMGGAMGALRAASLSAATTPAQLMRCFWSARAEIGVAVPLGLAGALLALGRRWEVRFLALLAAGGLVVALVLNELRAEEDAGDGGHTAGSVPAPAASAAAP